MTIENLFDNKNLNGLGWLAFFGTVLGNSLRMLTYMDYEFFNNLALFITSLLGVVFIILKVVIAFYTAREKIFNWKNRRLKERSDRIKKVKEKDDDIDI